MATKLESISRGFSHGNYANAYETQDVDVMLAKIRNRSQAFRDAAVLGFFSSYELDEIPGSDRDTFDAAYFSEHGQRCVALKYTESRQADYAREHEAYCGPDVAPRLISRPPRDKGSKNGKA